MGHMIFGVTAVLFGLSGVFLWWEDFGRVLCGVLPLALVIVGFVAIGAAMSARRQKQGATPELSPRRMAFDDTLRAATINVKRQPSS